MIATHDHWYRTRGEYLTYTKLNIGVTLYGIGMDDISIANINYSGGLCRQIDNVIFMVVGTGMAKRK